MIFSDKQGGLVKYPQRRLFFVTFFQLKEKK